jgi:energy-coupling factor transporter ATP-binding protein EcfA2
MNTITAPPGEPLLRTLAPALRGLERSLRGWLDGKHRQPPATMTRAALEGVAGDLERQSAALDVERPLLVVMLMGGTGVGKSTLLNALAGGGIAQASFQRPTTRDPVVYYHETVRTDRLDPALRHCRLMPHDRPALEQKVIVDTPDLDSNDLSNREKLLRLLPVADIVLYVGSQEKYHDKLGWELFLEQRKRRAFAFVLNKWDRCQHAGAEGLRPDQDLLRDLESEGFRSPLLFRTCAQHWVDKAAGNGTAEPPEDEQFLDLAHWLEMGLTRLEIEAIKARGVSQTLQHLQQVLAAACPPDLADPARQTVAAWEGEFGAEATASAEVLLNTLEPYQREIEHHFTVEGYRRFHGLMAVYLGLFTKARYATTSLRDRIPFMPKSQQAPAAPATTWDVALFSRACTDMAASSHLDARGKALANRLLVEADAHGFPLSLLSEPVEAATKIDWRSRFTQTLIEVMQDVEQQWARPRGVRRWVQTGLVILSDWLPTLALLGACCALLWRYFDPSGRGYQVQLADALLPPAVTLIVLIVLHLLITLLLPLRWRNIRGEFRRQLEKRVRAVLSGVYAPLPSDVADGVREERQRIEALQKETEDVAKWLQEREQSASIVGLYGR